MKRVKKSQSLSRIGVRLAPIFFLFVLTGGPARSQETPQVISVSSEGAVKVLNNNFAAAKEQAVQIALRKSVRTVLTTLLDPKGPGSNAETPWDRLIGEETRYVHSYKFLNEWVDEEAGLYRVTLQVNVVLDALQTDLSRAGIAHKWDDRPRLLILIDERTLASFDAETFLFLPSASEKEFVAVFQEKGYTVLDRKELLRFPDKGLILQAVEGDASAASVVGLKLGVDLVIMGKTEVSVESGPVEGTEEKEVRAEITAYLYQVKPPQRIATNTKTLKLLRANVTAGTFAVTRQAGRELSKMMVDPVYRTWASGAP